MLQIKAFALLMDNAAPMFALLIDITILMYRYHNLQRISCKDSTTATLALNDQRN